MIEGSAPSARMIVHGHFYQPPRENPWTGRIDPQPTAAPFHDWNERVHMECYLSNVFADLETETGEQVVNNFERMSFNVGPTLMSWMEKIHPRTYLRILKADQKSVERLGHGNAIAQSFHHTILPLSDERTARTEIRWGIADFEHRFGRRPQGLWLPETAANDNVLGLLIDEGIAFTILAPHQAAQWRPEGRKRWIDVADRPIDTRRPYRYRHPDGSGRDLTLFFYDGEIAKSIAFESLTTSAPAFVDAFATRYERDGQVVHAATDGETYGHHQKFGEIGLAYALFVEVERRGIEVTNYAAYLEEHAVDHEARIVPGRGTSWSCAHGVGRWIEDCGCSTRSLEGWNQQWRTPLREGLEIVKAHADDVYERLGASLLRDPWGARDRYVDVVLQKTDIADFLGAEAGTSLDENEALIAARLLELQRHALAMFTSCGWFFADIGDIETVQILRYALRTIEAIEELDQPSPREAFRATLEQAKSNVADLGTGADVLDSIEAR